METAILTGLLEIAAYSAALFVGVLLFRALFYRWLSPALRYALWFLVLLRLVVPVTFESGIHLITLREEAHVQAAPVPTVAALPQMATALPDSGAPRLDGGAQAEGPVEQPVLPVERTVWRPNWRQALLLLWAAGGVAVLLTHFALAARLERRIRRLGQAPGHGVQRLCDGIRADIGIRARLSVVLLDDITSPALTVALRPKLLLPDLLALNAPREQLGFSLLHELMHFKRRDYLVCILMTLLCAIWWFNPVVWMLQKYLRMDMESACDAQAVANFSAEQKLRYAKLLLELGQRE